MTLKDTKIVIPEVPIKWTKQIRSGKTNIWNEGSTDKTKPELRLEPPIIGLYAERFEDAWYWVCGCNICLENDKSWGYSVCEEHNVCVTCGTHRKDLTETPWGDPKGFECKPCHQKDLDERKVEALTNALLNNHSEDDTFYTENIICPKCATVFDDYYVSPEENEIECFICGTNFNVEMEYETRFTTTLKKP